jgi:glycerol-3-phosphate dehydrogenase
LESLVRTGAAGAFGVAIIGGGINGCGVARDAAGRGWSVFLCEKNDLASSTSSASSKLIHGGLRYLEHFRFRLVREALIEREILWRIAPHIVWPLRFVLPHRKDLRPAWVLRIGLFLYDHLGGRRLLPPPARCGWPPIRWANLSRRNIRSDLNIRIAGPTTRDSSSSMRGTQPTWAP